MAVETKHWKATDLHRVRDVPPVLVHGRRAYPYASTARCEQMDPITSCLLFSTGADDVCAFGLEELSYDENISVWAYLQVLVIVYDCEKAAFKTDVTRGVWALAPALRTAVDHVTGTARSYRQCAAAIMALMAKCDPQDVYCVHSRRSTHVG